MGLVLGVSPELVLSVSPERWLKGFYLRAVPALVIGALERARVPGMPRVTGDFWVRGMWALLAWPRTTLIPSTHDCHVSTYLEVVGKRLVKKRLKRLKRTYRNG